MALFKFQNYSAIKNAQNNPRAIATVDMVNGSFVKIVDNYTANGVTYKEAAVPFADADDIKLNDVWVVFNIVDKPEILNYSDFKIKAGEHVRAFKLNNLVGEIIEISADAVTDAFSDVSKGDLLIHRSAADTTDTMKLKKAGVSDSGYPVAFKVIDKTAFGSFIVDGPGAGYELKIVSIPAEE